MPTPANDAYAISELYAKILKTTSLAWDIPAHQLSDGHKGKGIPRKTPDRNRFGTDQQANYGLNWLATYSDLIALNAAWLG